MRQSNLEKQSLTLRNANETKNQIITKDQQSLTRTKMETKYGGKGDTDRNNQVSSRLNEQE